jgi:hypothetical protein
LFARNRITNPPFAGMLIVSFSGRASEAPFQTLFGVALACSG